MNTETMRGQLLDVAKVITYIGAGDATVTFVSRATGNRLTYRFARPVEMPDRPRPIWVQLLNGPDNENDYTFLGTIWPNSPQWMFRYKANDAVPENATSVKTMRWLVHAINTRPDNLLDEVDVWHEGKCGRCGRKLTVPASIESGFGPECVKHV